MHVAASAQTEDVAFIRGNRYFDYITSRKGNSISSRNHSIDSFPDDLERKVYLMTYFEDYMSKTLEREVDWTFKDEARTKNMAYLVKYHRMKSAIVFMLSNEVVQVGLQDTRGDPKRTLLQRRSK